MKGISLYIHIPFCKQKCMYCDFPSYGNKDELMEEYIQCLIEEINIKCKNFFIHSIFIGGGTPSYLPNELMEKLLNSINKLNLRDNIEFTVECNPGTLTEEKLKIMKNFGVNRISLGLQAVQSTLLKSIGRIHDFKEFEESFSLARKTGFKNINIDIMFGLPNQTVEQWKETLKIVTSLEPEHISAYSLIIEEGTAFYEMYDSGKLRLPSEDEERKMYEVTLEVLKAKGYCQYEISNYAKKGKECKHNLVYWNSKEWIGIGSAAASFINGERLKNYSLIEDYINSVKNNNNTYEEIIKNTEKDNMEEFMFMGLRKIEGIEERDFESRFNKSIDEVYINVINEHISRGLLIRAGGRIYLSGKGIELSNLVMSDFLLE